MSKKFIDSQGKRKVTEDVFHFRTYIVGNIQSTLPFERLRKPTECPTFWIKKYVYPFLLFYFSLKITITLLKNNLSSSLAESRNLNALPLILHTITVTLVISVPKVFFLNYIQSI